MNTTAMFHCSELMRPRAMFPAYVYDNDTKSWTLTDVVCDKNQARKLGLAPNIRRYGCCILANLASEVAMSADDLERFLRDVEFQYGKLTAHLISHIKMHNQNEELAMILRKRSALDAFNAVPSKYRYPGLTETLVLRSDYLLPLTYCELPVNAQDSSLLLYNVKGAAWETQIGEGVERLDRVFTLGDHKFCLPKHYYLFTPGELIDVASKIGQALHPAIREDGCS